MRLLACIALVGAAFGLVGCSAGHGYKLPRSQSRRADVLDAIYDRMLGALDRNGTNENVILQSATRGERMVYVLLATDYEIGDGGLYQLFWNQAGDLVDAAIAAARTIRAERYERLLERAANAVFPRGVPRDVDRRRKVLGCPGYCDDPRLDRLDRESRERSFAPRLRAYVRSHPDEFFYG